MYAKLYVSSFKSYKGAEMYQVYKIINAQSKVIYVGVTKKSKGYLNRFKEHQSAAVGIWKERDLLLHRVMREEGINNFTVELIVDNVNDSDVSSYERQYVKEYNTYYKDGSGCNMTLGGFGNLGYVFTDEVKSKQSEASKAYWKRLKADTEKYQELVSQRSQRMRGIPKSEEHKRKLSAIAATRTGSKNSFYGKHHSSETKDVVSKSNGAAVLMLDIHTEELLQEFQSAVKAGQYLIEQGLTSNKWANSRILEVCHNQAKSAYGYKWRFK